MKLSNGLLIFSVIFVLSITVRTQSGVVFEIQRSVIAGGGGSAVSGTFELESTAGQAVTGNASGSTFSLASGFWTPAPFAPTAAPVSITGRVITTSGSGIANALLLLVNSEGQGTMNRSNSFGYFRFENVPAGELYILETKHKGYSFAARVISVVDDISRLEISPLP